MKDKPSYYAVLTADVRYDNRLSSSEKLFFAEITALSDKNGFCWASNKYFAELYGVARSTVSSWVTSLEKLNYIAVHYKKDGDQIISRKITPVHIMQQGVFRNLNGGGQKTRRGCSENPKENTTSNNTTSNNIYTSDFEEFWEKYDNKVGKKKSFQKWKRLSKSDKQAIFENLPIFLTHYPNKEYRPHPQTYFNNRYWEDEKFQQPKSNRNGQAKKSGQGKENRTETFIRRGQELFSEGNG